MFQVSVLTILTDLPIIVGLLYLAMQTYKWKAAGIIGKIEESAVKQKAMEVIEKIEESVLMDRRSHLNSSSCQRRIHMSQFWLKELV